jgi:aldehyde:ferredoxin oxidoreductase
MRIVRIDMTTQQVAIAESPSAYAELGGRGLTSTLLAAEVDPLCDALGADNKVFIAPGLLTGTTAPCTARTSVGAKSPLTGGIKESNVGGIAGQHLAAHRIKALVIEGTPPTGHLWVVVIANDEVSLAVRDDLAGLGNYDTALRLRQQYGLKSAVISLGPAGERGATIATVAVSDQEGRPARHAARGGMGTVLASKGIKAIVIGHPRDAIVKAANPEQFKVPVSAFAKTTVVAKKALTDYGCAVLVNGVNGVGGLPTNSYTTGFNAFAAAISGERLRELCHERGGATGHSCSRGCAVRCSNIFNDADGHYVSSGVEFETIALLGSNCGLNDLDRIATLDHLCDDLGIDTMDMGVALGVAMEGGLLPYGDFDAMHQAISSVATATGFGVILGRGAAATGLALGVARVPVVKGQAMAAYDPRALKGMGVTYATSPMGADHTAGPAVMGRGGVDCHQAAEQLDLSRILQKIIMIMDTLGMCVFAGAVPENLPVFASMAGAFLGRDVTPEGLLNQAAQLLTLETAFNERAGICSSDNDVPAFFRTEALPNNGLVFDVPKDELAAFEYSTPTKWDAPFRTKP